MIVVPPVRTGAPAVARDGAVHTCLRVRRNAGVQPAVATQPQVSFTQQPSPRGRPTWIPDRLPRLDVERALAVVDLPLHGLELLQLR